MINIDERVWVLYVHVNKVNNKKYIGITSKSPKRRWRNGGGYIGNKYFYNAIKKYGWDGFDHIILADNLTTEKASLYEQSLIREWETLNPNKGYNLSGGGYDKRIISEETRKKMSEKAKGKNNPMYGVRLCGEKSGMFGKHLSDETKRKISQANKGRTRTEKEIQDGRERNLGGKNPSAKKVICDGVIYGSIKECADFYGKSADLMRMYMRGTRKMPQRFVELGLKYYQVNEVLEMEVA